MDYDVPSSVEVAEPSTLNKIATLGRKKGNRLSSSSLSDYFGSSKSSSLGRYISYENNNDM